MRTKQSILLAALLLLPAAGLALAPRATANDAASAGSKLEPLMQALQSGQQKVGKALDKKDLATVLAQTLEMEETVQKAKLETPPTAAAVKEPEKQKEFVTGFRKQMIELQKTLLDLETAALDGKLDDAKRIFDERLKQAKKDGHAKYKGD